MESWEEWNVFFQWLARQWPIILLAMVAAAVTLSPWVGGLFRWMLGVRPSRHQERRSESAGEPIRLAAKHIEKPSAYPLKGKRVIATGLITKLDTEKPFVELHAFPFTIDAEIDCEFPKDYAPDLHRREPLQLVSVVGTAVEHLAIKAGYSKRLKLRLTDGELRSPTFIDQFRNVWRDTPIAVLYQRLKYGF
jgi:hypothetical protein